MGLIGPHRDQGARKEREKWKGWKQDRRFFEEKKKKVDREQELREMNPHLPSRYNTTGKNNNNAAKHSPIIIIILNCVPTEYVLNQETV